MEAGEYGNAILSRWPLQAWVNYRLPRVIDETEPRGMLVATVSLPNIPKISFPASTHFPKVVNRKRRSTSLEMRAVWGWCGLRVHTWTTLVTSSERTA